MYQTKDYYLGLLLALYFLFGSIGFLAQVFLDFLNFDEITMASILSPVLVVPLWI